MNKQKRIEIYNEALNRWGVVNQVFMVMEECGELLNVLAKAHRGRANREEIITELADVAIMVEQMAHFYGQEQFEAEKDRKSQTTACATSRTIRDLCASGFAMAKYGGALIH